MIKYRKAALLPMVGVGMVILSGCGGTPQSTTAGTAVTAEQAQQMKAKQEAFARQQQAQAHGVPAPGR